MQQLWKPIENLPPYYNRSPKMFVVIAKDVEIYNGQRYTTDPYCVWLNEGDICHRWPHLFQPTHYCELPSNFEY